MTCLKTKNICKVPVTISHLFKTDFLRTWIVDLIISAWKVYYFMMF